MTEYIHSVNISQEYFINIILFFSSGVVLCVLSDNKLIKEERKNQKNGNTEKSEQLNHRKFGKVLSLVREIKTQIPSLI